MKLLGHFKNRFGILIAFGKIQFGILTAYEFGETKEVEFGETKAPRNNVAVIISKLKVRKKLKVSCF